MPILAETNKRINDLLGQNQPRELTNEQLEAVQGRSENAEAQSTSPLVVGERRIPTQVSQKLNDLLRSR